MKSDFHDAEDPQHEGAVHVHVHPVKLYVGVFLALITLTIITVASSYVDIDGFIQPGTPAGAGAFNLGLAMLIATTKAALVVTWFMHLKDDNRFNALVFVGSVLFAGIFLAYTINDTAYRGETDPYNGVQVIPGTGERAPGGIPAPIAGEELLPGMQAPATGEPTGEAGDQAAGAAGVGGEHH